MKQAIGYVRVSTDRQATDGVSIDAQIDKIKAWAMLNGYELLHIYDDAGISGASMHNRDGLQTALSSIKKDMAFICYSLSRISRDLEDTLKISKTIQDAGADLVSLSEKIDTTGAVGKMIFNFMAVLNQFERDQISERTRMAMQFLRNTGKVYSHPPYGFDRVGDDLVINDVEQQTINQIEILLNQGWGHRKISTWLNAQGIPAKKGGLWYAKTVKNAVNGYAIAYRESLKIA